MIKSLVVTLLLVLISSGCASGPAPAPRQSLEMQEKWKAQVLQSYQEYVKLQLVSPASAQFPYEPSVSASYMPDKNVSTLVAMGQVDSQNRFGAMLRSSFIIG